MLSVQDWILTALVAAFAFRWPLVGLTLAANCFILRNLYAEPEAGAADSSSPMVGVVLPAVVFLIVLAKLSTRSLASIRARFRWGEFDTFILGMGLLLAFGSLDAPSFEYGMELTLRYWFLAATFYFAVRLLNSAEPSMAMSESTKVMWSFLALGTVLAILALATLDPEMGTKRFHLGEEGSTIQVAYLMSYAFCIGSYYLIVEAPYRWLGGLVGGASSVLLVGGILLTQTRGALAVCALAIIYSTARWIQAGPNRAQAMVRPVAILAILLAVGFMSEGYLAGLFAPTSSRISSLGTEDVNSGSVTVAIRLSMQELAWNRFLKSPFWGAGTGIWKDDPIGYPHNIFFEAASQSGIAGLAFTGILVWGVMKHVWRAFRGHSNVAALLGLLTLSAFLQAQFSGCIHMHKSLYLFGALLLGSLQNQPPPASTGEQSAGVTAASVAIDGTTGSSPH
jgi:O-antigen ligase